MTAVRGVTTVASQQVPERQSSRWDRLDDLAARLSDKLNPILVKETRQALKSRQFVVTFSVLLFAALGWTIIGSLSMMPGIYVTPSAKPMLMGYYVVLAIPMMMVVPLAAYRSLEGEIDDGTLELLSISALSPWQIVLGKLSSALLQMLLYFVPLFPCVAYSYTLRGVDLPTTMLLLGALLVGAIMLTIIAIFFAPLTVSRTGRLLTMLALLAVILGTEWSAGFMAGSLIYQGNIIPADATLFVIVSILFVCGSFGHLLLTATAAQLTPESENRSTSLRLSLLAVTIVSVAIAAYAVARLSGNDSNQLTENVLEAVAVIIVVGLAVLWTASGSMMAAESPNLTPRIRRDLPNSFLSRMALTWLTPGPGTGVVFASIIVFMLAIGVSGGVTYVATLMDNPPPAAWSSTVSQFCEVSAAYVVIFFVIVRMIMTVVRINNHPRVEVGMVAFIAVCVVTAFIPYSIQLYLNDYRDFEYSAWQITNWVWTLGIASFGQLPTNYHWWITRAALLAFLANLVFTAAVTMPRRIATPRRVREVLESES